ncbi:hypothetical protein IX296_000069 [Bacteroides pyogenes]|nr:hypothetical protein [Bacteroides pyogenes]MBR8723699.1 hypothetical protein [Bacteroides pyogenes]MBR8737210.1 hypothetical protein [Bacteroides pyogenes]MBR8752787.1 hypothetical protein [Bacteroides pyogenes]MBR8794157.1 hypothetical protein [Bacteroides pyogenes]
MVYSIALLSYTFMLVSKNEMTGKYPDKILYLNNVFIE